MTSRHSARQEQRPHRRIDHVQTPRAPPTNALAQQLPSRNSEILFTTDRKGDAENLRYGSIDKYKVPKYRTAGYGRLVGLDRRFKIIAKSGVEQRIEDESLDLSIKSRDFPLLLKQKNEDQAAPVQRSKSFEVDVISEQHDFVSFGRKRRKLSHERAVGSLEFTGSHTIINGNETGSSESDSESSASSEHGEAEGRSHNWAAFEAFKNDPDNKRYIELRSQTERDPQNIQAWLDFIEQQESYFLLTSGGSKKSLDSSQRRAVTDMRVSLYERAIAVVKDKSGKEKLTLGFMREGSRIWDTDKQMKEWTAVLTPTTSIHVWYKFINFQQTNAVLFSYEKCLDTYLKVFAMAASLQGEDQDYHRCYTILRLTHFMHEAGYSERSLALWQALLEYNLLYPPSESCNLQTFEAFWEAEQPRIGEKGAKGWRSGYEQEVPSREDMPLVGLGEVSLFRDWGSAEAQRSTRDILPARTLDETVEDDPYRVILFSDLKDFLFFSSSTDRGRSYLVEAFLHFCSLPPMYAAIGQCRKWWMDPMMCNFMPGSVSGALSETSTLFAPKDSPWDVWGISGQRSQGLADFAVRALTLLAESPDSDDELADYVIACQLRDNPKAARKLAKSLLKRKPNSILLYNAFALTEARGGDIEAANRVWSTALSMATSLGPTAQQRQITLWHSWIWELMVAGSQIYALNLLIEAVPLKDVTEHVLQQARHDHEIASAQRLRADAYFREQIADCVSQSEATVADFTALYALLQYLKNGRDFDEVVNIYQSTLAFVSKQRRPDVVERLHQSRARHAHYHASAAASGYRPMQLIPLLAESVTVFPENMIFSNLYDTYMRRAGAVDRVRTLSVRETASPTVVSLLRKIRSEMSLQLFSGSTTHSVRRAFVKATDTNSPLRSCAAVWLTWIDWELRLTSHQGQKNQNQVKEVYLSALRNCPWFKDVYLQGFMEDGIRQSLTVEQIEAIYKSLEERGLRIRHDISDLIDDK